MADPTIPRNWQAVNPFDYEDFHGQRDDSGWFMPRSSGPTYDPGGVGGVGEMPGLASDPGWDTMTRLSRAFGMGSAALSAPGWWKALTVPAVSPFVGNDLWRSYRNTQQLNGDHPTQLNQQHWENALGRALMSGGYRQK